VAIAYRVKARLRDCYRCADPDSARQMLSDLQGHCLKKRCCVEAFSTLS
jgi:hypothetical protein